MSDDHVTRAEFKEAIDPVREDVRDIKQAVEPIPEMLVQMRAANTATAKNTKDIGELNKWRWALTGGGAAVTFLLGGAGGAAVLWEVLK